MNVGSSWWWLPLACALVSLGCAGGSEGPNCEPARKLEGTTALPDEVDAILEAKCRTCHSRPTQMYAPMPIVTWEDTQAPFPGKAGGAPIYELAEQRIHNERFPMPPITKPQLTKEERAVIDAWVAQCAPAKKD